MSAARIRRHVASARHQMNLARAGMPIAFDSPQQPSEPGFFALIGAFVFACALFVVGVIAFLGICTTDPVLRAAGAAYWVAFLGYSCSDSILAFSRRHRLYYRACEKLCGLGLRKNPF